MTSRAGLRASTKATAQLLGGAALALAALCIGPLRGAELAADEPARASGAEVAPSALREHADEVASYTLTARLDEVAHVITGEGTLRFRNTSRASVRELPLHMYLNAWKSGDTRFARSRATDFRGGNPGARGSITLTALALEGGVDLLGTLRVAPECGEGDETLVTVTLPEPLAPGASLTLRLAFRSELPALDLRTGYVGSFHMVGQWFPKLAALSPEGTFARFPFERLSEFFADFGTYDVTIDAPAAMVVGATGAPVEVTTGGPRRRHRYVARDVHDFAFTAWDGFDERTITSDGVRLRCLFPRGEDAAAAVELDAAARGLPALSRRFGRYPYETLTIVHPPDGAIEAGGMEYPTLITTGGHWYATHTGARELEGLTLHELSHQWFYGVVATNEHLYPVLDEGLASFATTLVLDELYPGSSALALPGLNLSWAPIERLIAVEAPVDGRLLRPAADFESGAAYGALVYYRAATLLSSLDRITRGGVARAVARFAREGRFAHPSPDDLVRAVEVEAGPTAARALLRAFEHGAELDALVDGVERAGDDATRARVRLRRRGTIAVPLEVELTVGGVVERHEWPAEQALVTLEARAPGRLERVVIDPEHLALLDADLTNNVLGRGDGPLAPRVLVGAALVGALSAALITP